MRPERVEGAEEQETKRELSGAPPLSFEIAFILGCLAAAFLLYGKPQLAQLIVGWLAP